MLKKTIGFHALSLVLSLNGFAGGDPVFTDRDPISRAVTAKGKTLQQFCLEREAINGVIGKCLLSQFGITSQFKMEYDFQGNSETSGGTWTAIGPVFTADLAKQFLATLANLDFESFLDSLQNRTGENWQFNALKVNLADLDDFVLQLEKLENANQAQDYVTRAQKEKTQTIFENKEQIFLGIFDRIHSVHGGMENLEQAMRKEGYNTWRSYVAIKGSLFDDKIGSVDPKKFRSREWKNAPESVATGTKYIPFEVVLNSDGSKLIQAAVLEAKNMIFFTDATENSEDTANPFSVLDHITVLQVSLDNRNPNMESLRAEVLNTKIRVNVMKADHGNGVVSYIAPTGEIGIGFERLTYRFDSDLRPETPGTVTQFDVQGMLFTAALGLELNFHLGKGFHFKSNYSFEFKNTGFRDGDTASNGTNVLNHTKFVDRDAAKEFLYVPERTSEDGQNTYDAYYRTDKWINYRRTQSQKLGFAVSKRFGKKHPFALTAFYNRVLSQKHKVTIGSYAADVVQSENAYFFKAQDIAPYLRLPVQQAGLRITF